MTRSTSKLRQLWGPACAPASTRITLSLHGEGRITVDRRTEAAWRALNAVLVAHNYRTRRADTGAYNCRRITGGTGYSLHAYGTAADVNWQSNPYGKRLVTDMPRAMIDAILAIRTRGGHRVFRWGGDYATNKDAMHFEIVASPAELATGIDPRTVPGAPPAPPPPPPAKEGPLMALTDQEQRELLDKVRAIDLRTQAIQNETTAGADSTKGGISRRVLASLSRIEAALKKG